MPRLTVVVEQCLAPVPGGTGRYARQIAGALARWAPAGWTVGTVSAFHRDVTAARIPGVPGPRRLPSGRRSLTRLWQYGLPPWPRGSSLHATTPLFSERVSRYPRLGLGGATRDTGRRPVVVTVHDTVPWTHPETLTRRGVSWHIAMVRRAVDRAHALVVPTQAVADELGALFPALEDRVHVIGHGVTPLPVPADAVARRYRLGLPDRYLLSLATLEPRKGLDVLIEALGRPEAAGMSVAVVGRPGWGGLDPAAIAQRNGVRPDRVLVLGALPDDDLAAVLAGAAALAAPSRAEGFGLPVLEAMAAGVPVIHSDAPALVEVAGGAGLTVPVGDSGALAAGLGRVLNDQALAAVMGAAGLRRAADFSWQRAAELTWELHLSLAR